MVCDDALWVMYANEALDYGFDLAKAVEIELIVEAIEDINSANDIKTVTSPREGI